MKAKGRFPWEDIPDTEIADFEDQIRAAIDEIAADRILAAFQTRGLRVIRKTKDPGVADAILAAIADRRALSAIRIGDGEMNLIAYRRYPGTPNLDRHLAEAIVLRQPDSFLIGEEWIIALQEMMMGAIAQADIVGVPGLLGGAPPDAGGWIEAFRTGPRGYHGQFRGRQYLPALAGGGLLDGKTIANSVFYFSVIANLDRLIGAVDDVLLITSRNELLARLQRKYPDQRFTLLPVGNKKDQRRLEARHPYFLPEMAAALPTDMSGCLCLVGAGPWAEIYCSWIKQRGGVAIDIGSGFDLLAGATIRVVHRALPEEELATYRLDKD